MIDGQEFYLEINGIQNVEVIDLNPSQTQQTKTVLDEINNAESLDAVEGKLSNIDKKFFKDVFKQVEQRGPDFVEPKLPGKVNNLDNQMPKAVEELQVVRDGNKNTKKDQKKKTYLEIKQEKYLKFLEDEKESQAKSDAERFKALDCIMKIMDHQLNLIKKETQQMAEVQMENDQQLINLDEHLSMAENKIFKDYHEARLRKQKLDIEEGLYFEDEPILNRPDMTDDELLDELEAHEELRKYAQSLKKRQENFKMVDVAELVVDNKMLINRIDDILEQKHSADDGIKYSELQSHRDKLQQSVSASISGLLVSRSADDLDDLDEFNDSLINKMYTNLVENKYEEEKPAKKKVSKVAKTKNVRPVTAGPKKSLYAPVPSLPIITEVGRKASSRLFDYEQKQKSQ